ncbi:hypothetical protein SEUCBS140593_009961 [Sporothrix eucalyptigena]|uniref:Proteophosphoglycan ppg4 n=1 Tax=Sporothrix eucalyptigena TaxID=1812306 RepID=A0ABP0CZ59_9PEZI
MGLMTLLARKINPDKHQPQLRAPTYDRKISSKSPVRLVQTVSPSGTVSHGHGSSDASKSLSKGLKSHQYPSSPLSQASFSEESPAPAPVVLGFRGDDAPSRPNTSYGKLDADARRIGTLHSPSTTSLKSSRLSQLVTPRTRSSLVPAPASASKPTTPSTAAQMKQKAHRPQNSISSSKLARSIRSDGGKGYVDLLDAQSEFKPSDFHTRVKAAGTRDYGEDVADRNIGVNGCDLDSQPVQAFYAIRPGASSRASAFDQRRPFSSWNRPPNFSDDEDDNMYHPQVIKQASIDSALWSKSLNSSHPAFYGNAHSQAILSAAALQKSRALKRQTYNAVPSTASLGAYGTPSLAEIEALHEQQRLLNRKARGHSLQVAVHDANKLVSVWDTTSPESENSSGGVRPSTSGIIKTSRSRSQSRDNARDYSRAASIITPRPRSQSGETEEHTPGRANSIRHWSITSTAPTTSSSSSATHGRRPHSRHTANTSIDLSTTGPPSTVNSSLGSVHGDGIKKMQSPKPDSRQPPALLQSPRFNIDDYVSSDDDSFIASQAERSASEEDLLFSSGYGKMGIQLPGLEDSFSAPAPIALVRSPRLANPKPVDDFRSAFGEPPLMSKFMLQKMASDESLNLDRSRSQRRRSVGASEAGPRKKSSREELGSQTQSPARRSETKRMSALLSSSTATGHTHHGNGALGSNSLLYHPRPNPHLSHSNNVGEQVIEEERSEKVDVATAIRLRKEAKSRKRASMMSIASQTSGRGLVKTVNIEGRKDGTSHEAKINALRNKINAMTADRARDISETSNVSKLVKSVREEHEHALESDGE